MISLLVAGVACARTYSISGRVTGYDGLPVDSCSVMLFNPDFNPAIVTESDADGFYRLDSVPEGRYAVIRKRLLSQIESGNPPPLTLFVLVRQFQLPAAAQCRRMARLHARATRAQAYDAIK